MSRTDKASRVIRAPAQKLYAAHLEADALAQWRPPQGMRAEIYAFDARVGGGYRMAFIYVDAAGEGRGKTSEDADEFTGEFLALEPATRIVERVDFQSDDPTFTGPLTITTTFTPLAEGTLVEIVCENVPPGISAEDHAVGLASTLANLAAFAE